MLDMKARTRRRHVAQRYFEKHRADDRTRVETLRVTLYLEGKLLEGFGMEDSLNQGESFYQPDFAG